MGNRTTLYSNHVEMGGKMVDFAGWVMPINYGSQIEEHHQVRRDAGMFDVSHMTVVDLKGDDVRAYLKKLLANNVDRLKESGKAIYSCMLNENGGVIDDLITYYIDEDFFRVVVNAATREKDLAWMRKQLASFNTELTERDDLAMIAIQGPNARDKVIPLLEESCRQAASNLGNFYATFCGEWFVARTGYTGEDGFEIMLPNSDAPAFWQRLAANGVKPCGLGARDTLRLEAGMNLYGTDMDETTSPLESGLGWTIAWEPSDRDFIGRSALEEFKKSNDKKFVGLLLEGKGVLRGHQKIYLDDAEAGEITSGTFSPTLGKSIALARVSKNITEKCLVDIRGKKEPARVVKAPFARNGKACIDL